MPLEWDERQWLGEDVGWLCARVNFVNGEELVRVHLSRVSDMLQLGQRAKSWKCSLGIVVDVSIGAGDSSDCTFDRTKSQVSRDS